MNDAFGHELNIEDRVLYSVSSSSGTRYSIGKITKFLPNKKPEYSYRPDMISVLKDDGNKVSVYPSNVVLISKLK